jgi:hypothetical protein
MTARPPPWQRHDSRPAEATIQKAVTTAFGYAPSQFTITISIAAGTYNEAINTPTYAGPNLVIDGNVAANVTINTTGAGCIGVTLVQTL